jgi:oligoendopeptidase F
MLNPKILDHILKKEVKPTISSLINQTLTIGSLPVWLERWSELVKSVDEISAEVYRCATKDVTDEAAQVIFEQFLEQLQPEFESANTALKAKVLALENFVPPSEYHQMLFRFQNSLKISDEAILAAQADLEIRASEYDEITAGLTVNWNGHKLGLSQLQGLISDPDRSIREAVWRASSAAWTENADSLTGLFQDLTARRNALARAAGFSDYRSFRWQELERFDDLPSDCLKLHSIIEREIVPLSRALLKRRRVQLGLELLRPWDRLVNPLNQAVLQPNVDATGFVGLAARIFEQLDPQLAVWYSKFQSQLDLEARVNKAPGAYCVFFPKTGLPYIHMNATCTHTDLMTLMHECGHAFHALASSEAQTLTWNTEGPVEFCELAAISMEWLALGVFEVAGVYSSQDTARARQNQLETLIMDLPRLAAADAFQHWLYVEAPQASPLELHQKWFELWTRFAPGIDWTDLEQSTSMGWLQVGHLFESPFYMFEYILAGLGAVQFWKNAREQPAQAMKTYKAALKLGYTQSSRKLFVAAGVSPTFDQKTVQTLAVWLKHELEL